MDLFLGSIESILVKITSFIKIFNFLKPLTDLFTRYESQLHKSVKVYSIDILSHYKMIGHDLCGQDEFQNVDLNICVQTWHPVSVLGHRQGFELAVPVAVFNILNSESLNINF